MGPGGFWPSTPSPAGWTGLWRAEKAGAEQRGVPGRGTAHTQPKGHSGAPVGEGQEKGPDHQGREVPTPRSLSWPQWARPGRPPKLSGNLDKMQTAVWSIWGGASLPGGGPRPGATALTPPRWVCSSHGTLEGARPRSSGAGGQGCRGPQHLPLSRSLGRRRPAHPSSGGVGHRLRAGAAGRGAQSGLQPAPASRTCSHLFLPFRWLCRHR